MSQNPSLCGQYTGFTQWRILKRQGVWSRKGFIEGSKQGKWVAHAQKAWTLWWFSGKSFYSRNFEGGLQDLWPPFDWLIGQCSRNLVLRLKLPSSPGGEGLGRGLVTAEEPRDVLLSIYIYILWGRARPLLHLRLFLTPPLLFLHSLSLLTSNCLNLPFRTQGRYRRPKLFPKIWYGGHRKTFRPGGPHRVPLGFRDNPGYWVGHCF